MRKNSIKNIRINEEVRRQLQEIIMTELKDPRVDPMSSVTKVEVAPDLKTCKAYVSVLGDAKAMESTMEGLTKAEGFIRRELARTVNLARDEERHVPSPEDEAKDEADVLPEEKMKGQPSDGMKEDPEGGTAD